jgi:hypothetical protein
MVGFHVGNTLSEGGGVARGVCTKDAHDNLTSVVERTYVFRDSGGVKFRDDDGTLVPIAGDTPVSMNMWGFTPDYFAHSDTLFKTFLEERGQELKSEFFIPLVVNHLITHRQAAVKILPSASQWFGVTYRDDRPRVVGRLQELHDAGIYPPRLW